MADIQRINMLADKALACLSKRRTRRVVQPMAYVLARTALAYRLRTKALRLQGALDNALQCERVASRYAFMAECFKGD